MGRDLFFSIEGLDATAVDHSYFPFKTEECIQIAIHLSII